jgi:hypothetical protein
MSNLKARKEVFNAIKLHGPFSSTALPAYLSLSYTVTAINMAVSELVYLGRVSVSKERQLSAI